MTKWASPISFDYHPCPLVALNLTPLAYKEVLILPPDYPELLPGGPRPKRVDENRAPPECYFLDSLSSSRIRTTERSLGDRYPQLSNRKRDREEFSSDPWDSTLRELREKVAILSELDPWDIHTDIDVASDDLLDLFSLASGMIEYKTEYLVSCPYPHFPQLLFRDAFQNIAAGLLVLYQSFFLNLKIEFGIVTILLSFGF